MSRRSIWFEVRYKPILLLALTVLSIQMFPGRAAHQWPVEPKAVIEETLVSVDDPTFGPYDPTTGNGTIARILDLNGIKYFESSAPILMRPPPDDYYFRYLTGIPVVNASNHWRLYFKHYVTNVGEILIENCQMDGWHAYLVAPDGVLWRLHKYQVESPSSLPQNATIVANMSYQIHNIPEHRVTFLFSFMGGGAIIDSWRVGREIIKFIGIKYDLPRISLRRIQPGKVEIGPPRLIQYSFSIENIQDEVLEISLDYKFGETTVWEMNLWPSGNQGEVGSMELSLKPGELKTINMSSYFPDDKDDHAVLIYFGVIIIRGALAPPLKAEIWENLYGSNSYLGIKQAWIWMDPYGLKSNGSGLSLFIAVAPYISPFSKDVLPRDHYVRLTIFDAHYRKPLHGPVDLLIDTTIRKGAEMILNYTIPKDFLLNGEGRYIAQIDTFRRGGKGADMHLARVSIPFQVRLPDLSIKGLEVGRGASGFVERVIVSVENLGSWPARNATVTLYIDEVKISEKSISIDPGEISVVELDFEPRGRRFLITVECLSYDSFPDINLSNNKASMTIKEGDGDLDNFMLALAIMIPIAALMVFGIMWKRIAKNRVGRARDGP
ncbi:MAG: hypothetical protein QW371_02665 [Candidatus Bathyarchaeia archaeon]